ncbi:MAG: DsrH/TusB family sulfur metabolism protein [Methylicorpusculum sp.]|uniref:DsrH/TusB family sulfur metabolism protein n=1 Tax=Methylicorpusculum sp. TaxID=2713644 RepID=UPI00271FA672|nr:DsrH/TusB family sulfur metabolism protein [Methylicorpusculum sp.]MDO8844552.1 DsrH/TusB family sulfur metabolism protein [Methylicorpusculum sp.]MDO8941152.1 DsrH/TusB family sulfur metabolism protein [Methylicorpusculum sp.]MDO9240930.1 DsrH/TusB family sulfur metabolism protein [Methylicorpusculum sp.]MDP2204187.1 DsrH/TusB family sulfur metabolism protein [Methylicorpusculum sp.]
MLHLVFESSPEPIVLERIDKGDDVVFIGMSVQRLISQAFKEKIRGLSKEIKWYALQDALLIHGIQPSEFPDNIEVIGYLDLIRLTTVNEVIHSWS